MSSLAVAGGGDEAQPGLDAALRQALALVEQASALLSPYVQVLSSKQRQKLIPVPVRLPEVAHAMAQAATVHPEVSVLAKRWDGQRVLSDIEASQQLAVLAHQTAALLKLAEDGRRTRLADAYTATLSLYRVAKAALPDDPDLNTLVAPLAKLYAARDKPSTDRSRGPSEPPPRPTPAGTASAGPPAEGTSAGPSGGCGAPGPRARSMADPHEDAVAHDSTTAKFVPATGWVSAAGVTGARGYGEMRGHNGNLEAVPTVQLANDTHDPSGSTTAAGSTMSSDGVSDPDSTHALSTGAYRYARAGWMVSLSSGAALATAAVAGTVELVQS